MKYSSMKGSHQIGNNETECPICQKIFKAQDTFYAVRIWIN